MRWRAPAGVALVALVLTVALLRVRPNAAASAEKPRFTRTIDVDHFIKGNIHTHTDRSDGGDSPAAVIAWYMAHGYGFLALTDHNVLSDPLELARATPPGLTLIPGEEVSMYVDGRQVHVNALCTRSLIAGGTFPNAKGALQHAVSEVVRQGGVALVNHPNFDWALTADDVLSVPDARLVEIASGHPYVNTLGDPAHPSHEQIWDETLTSGQDRMGVAVDDVHHLAGPAEPAAYPGVGWVSVFASEPTEERICAALREGALYSSTGPELLLLRVTGASYEVRVAEGDAAVVFVGKGGRVLSRQRGPQATYELVGGEEYVRARVEAARGTLWAPAVRVTP